MALSEAVPTRVKAAFAPAERVHGALTASVERRVLQWLAERAPRWLSSDQLTVLGLSAQLGAGLCYGISRSHREALLLVNVCLVLNWLGDSLDGTLARTRRQQRPRYGFYVDHIVDLFGAIALLGGLGYSGLLHWQTAAGVLVMFLLLAGESYLATYTLSRFELSQGLFGPTELRLLLMLGNIAALRSPYVTLLGYKLLLFDVGATVALAAMFAVAVTTALRHTVQLYRQQPLP